LVGVWRICLVICGRLLRKVALGITQMTLAVIETAFAMP